MSELEAAPEGSVLSTATTEIPDFKWKDQVHVDHGGKLIESYSDDAEGFGKYAKSYHSAQTMIGQKGVIKPGAEASPEEMNKYYSDLGRPETAEGYDFKGIEWDEGVPRNEDSELEMIQSLFEMGATQDFARNLLAKVVGDQNIEYKAYQEGQEQNRRELDSVLQNEFGSALEHKVTLAATAGKEIYGDSFADIVNMKLEDGTVLGDQVAFIKGLAKHGQLLTESDFGDFGKIQQTSMTPGEALSRKANLMADPQFSEAWMNKNHSGHEEAMRKMNEIYAAEGAQ